MIVYNVNRRWFTKQDTAESYRRSQGLKPGHTIKVGIGSREQLADLLNALCEPQADAAMSNPSNLHPQDRKDIIDRAYVEPQRAVPDFVPLFLLDPNQRAAVAADRAARNISEDEDEDEDEPIGPSSMSSNVGVVYNETRKR